MKQKELKQGFPLTKDERTRIEPHPELKADELTEKDIIPVPETKKEREALGWHKIEVVY